MLMRRASLRTTSRSSCPRSPALLAPGHRAVLRPLNVVKEGEQLTGVIFQPFNEVQGELATVSRTDAEVQSFARSNFHDECESAINEQINIEFNIGYIYHSLYAYFDRDNVALPGLAKYFKEASDEEREHAEKLMQYQNRRGGRVKLRSIVLPEVEYGQDKEKGDALYSMELALSLEKLNFTKLRDLIEVANRHSDASMADFVEGELLDDQVKDVKKVSEYVSQLRRVGKGLGVFVFDRQLHEEAA